MIHIPAWVMLSMRLHSLKSVPAKWRQHITMMGARVCSFIQKVILNIRQIYTMSQAMLPQSPRKHIG